MKRIAALFLLITFVSTLGFAQDRSSEFDANKMRERVKRLSADDFEGRGPGTAGGKRAAQYIADQMKASGVKPGNKGSYFQNVKLVGVKADPSTQLTATITKSPTNMYFRFGDDFVATTGAQAADVTDKPFIYLSAGVSNAEFNESLALAAEAGTDFSGVLCGRATWKEGIPVYGKQGLAALEDWLSTEGVKNINAVNASLAPAKSVFSRLG